MRCLLVTLLATAATACVPVTPAVTPDLAATMTRGGGITGMSETIMLSSADGKPRGTWQRSDQTEARPIRLSSDEIVETLVTLDSTAARLPPSPPPDDRVCGDYILMRLEVRNGSTLRVAQEECPHRSDALAAYWRRLHETFDRLILAAR